MTPELKGFLLVGSIKILAVFVVLLLGVIMVIWLERRGCAFMQDRLGPNRVGPEGLLQGIADGLKNFMKEEVEPTAADRSIFFLAPAMSFVPSLMLFAVIPLST